MSEFQINLIVNVGATITAMIVGVLVARRYYIRSAKGLNKEAAELRRLTTLVLRGMENADLVELNRDPSGKIIGLIFRSAATLSATSSLSAKAEVIRSASGDHIETGTEM